MNVCMCVVWLLAFAVTYDFYKINNDIRTLFVLLIPFVINIVYMVCKTIQLKYINREIQDMEE